MTTYQFDRLSGHRHHRKWRNYTLIAAATLLFMMLVALMDGILNAASAATPAVFVLGFLGCTALALSIYFHLRFKARE